MRFSGFDAGAGGDGLQISAAGGKHDQVARILHRLLVGFDDFFGCFVVIDRGHVGDGLGESGAQIKVIERTHDGGEREAFHRQIDAKAFGAKVCLLDRFPQGSIEVGHEGAARDACLAASRLHGAGHTDTT